MTFSFSRSRRAILFDRGGTLIRDVPGLRDPGRAAPMPTAGAAVAAARSAGVLIGVVTNEPAIGEGRTSTSDFEAVRQRIEDLLGEFDAWFVCPHAEEAGSRLPEAPAGARRRGYGPLRDRAWHAGCHRRRAGGRIVTRILVARLGSMGDVLVSGPAIRAVAATPGAEVAVLCSPQGAAVARLLPGAAEVIVWSAPWILDPAPKATDHIDTLVDLVSAWGPSEAVIEAHVPVLATPYVVVHPGAPVEARAWPAERARKAVRLFADDGWTVAVVGNTGPAHLAAAMATPIVSLFSPVVPMIGWAPFGVPTILLGKQDAACRDTRARSCPVPGHPCLADVTEHAVRAAVTALAGVPERPLLTNAPGATS